MKLTTIFILFTLSAFTGLHAKTNLTPELELELIQELKVENYLTEQEFQFKSRQLKSQIPSQSPQLMGPPGTSEISGQILHAAVGIGGIVIDLFDADNNSYVDSQVSDPGGLYSFINLPAGNYYLGIFNPTDDYVDAIWSTTGTQFCSYCEIPAQAVINLGTGVTSSGHNLNLTVGATLTGQMVETGTGNPVDTLNVEITKPGDPSFNWFTFATFDGLGNYTVRGIPGGTYRVYLSANYEVNLHIPELYNNIQCNVCSSLAYDGMGTPVILSNGFTQSGIDFTLDVGASISGKVVDNISLNPMQDYSLVMIFNETNYLMSSQIIDGVLQDPGATGAFTIGGLLPGTYFAQGGDWGRDYYIRELYANKPCPWSGCDRGAGGTPINLGVAEHRVGVNFLLELGGKISGHVSDALSGLPINDNDQYMQFYDAAGNVAGGAFVDPITGDYESARAMPAGDYAVRTGTMFHGRFSPGYVMEKYDSSGNIDCPGITCDLTTADVNVIVSSTTANIDFALDTGFDFSGTITDLVTSSPLANVHVLVYDDMGEFAHWATTDINGDFTVSGLPAGTYYAKTNNGSNLPFMGLRPSAVGSWVDILYNNLSCPGSACDVTTGTPIVLGGSPDTGINGTSQFSFELPDGGTFTGRLIHSETTSGVANTRVNIYNSQGAFYGGYESDIDGYWMTSGFPPDTYYLVTQGRGGMVDVKYGGGYCFNGQCDPLTASPIVLGGTYNISNINMILKPDFIFRSGLD
ncbi:MAG: hypothetical protein DWP95_12095 [Proteobacteria bacterium]|nr:MAG: hypothetical protein DWP95_12095 [Pseudomonadota bacterium]